MTFKFSAFILLCLLRIGKCSNETETFVRTHKHTLWVKISLAPCRCSVSVSLFQSSFFVSVPLSSSWSKLICIKFKPPTDSKHSMGKWADTHSFDKNKKWNVKIKNHLLAFLFRCIYLQFSNHYYEFFFALAPQKNIANLFLLVVCGVVEGVNKLYYTPSKLELKQFFSKGGTERTLIKNIRIV